MPLPTHEPEISVAVGGDDIAAGVVCLMCGLAGSGKTTYAQQLERRGLVRLSIVEYIWRHFGQYGVDYNPDRYEGHQQLTGLLRTGKPAVLDYSFWQPAERARYAALIESHHRPWKLLVLATTRLRHERVWSFAASGSTPMLLFPSPTRSSTATRPYPRHRGERVRSAFGHERPRRK